MSLSSAALAQLPGISPNGVVNPTGSVHAAAVAPGSLVSIFGGNLAAGIASADCGTAAPLAFVSGSQITAQVPWEVPAGQVAVVVNNASGASQPATAQVTPFAPAIFSSGFGSPQAIAVNTDGSIAAPGGLMPGLTSHPATAGGTLTFYATGLGPVSPSAADGSASAGSRAGGLLRALATVRWSLSA